LKWFLLIKKPGPHKINFNKIITEWKFKQEVVNKMKNVLKGEFHEKVGEIRPWKERLGSN
jgi:hypothetical protein